MADDDIVTFVQNKPLAHSTNDNKTNSIGDSDNDEPISASTDLDHSEAILTGTAIAYYDATIHWHKSENDDYSEDLMTLESLQNDAIQCCIENSKQTTLDQFAGRT